MKCEIELDGKLRRVEVMHSGERARWTVDGSELDADAVEVSPGIYSILIGGKSFEARVEAKGDFQLRVTVASREYDATIRNSRKWKRDRVDVYKRQPLGPRASRAQRARSRRSAETLRHQKRNPRSRGRC